MRLWYWHNFSFVVKCVLKWVISCNWTQLHYFFSQHNTNKTFETRICSGENISYFSEHVTKLRYSLCAHHTASFNLILMVYCRNHRAVEFHVSLTSYDVFMFMLSVTCHVIIVFDVWQVTKCPRRKTAKDLYLLFTSRF